MASSKELVHKVATVVLVVVLALAGVVKLTPALNPEIYQYMASQFVLYTRVPPVALLHLDPYVFRVIVVATEFVCAVILIAGNPQQQRLVMYVLMVVMAGAIYSFATTGAMKECGAAVLMLAVVLVRFYTMPC